MVTVNSVFMPDIPRNNLSDRNPRWWLWLAVSVLVVVLDQLTKFLATDLLAYGQQVRVNALLNWTLLHNTGAAFSFLSEAGGWQRWFFTVITLGVSAVLLVWLARLPVGARWQALALVLILGGAIGNLWDRLVLGYVVDFIQVHYGDAYFPAFNIADSAITVGAAILIIDSLFNGREAPEGKKENG